MKDVALTLDYNHQSGLVHIVSTAFLDSEVLSLNLDTSADAPTLSNQNYQNITNSSFAYLYLTALDHFDKFASPDMYLTTFPNATTSAVLGLTKASDCANKTTDILPTASAYTAVTNPKRKGVQVKKKYKPITLKVKPVTSSMSENFQIKHCIISNPKPQSLSF
ncbi:hypothetical protein C0992_006226 [Termitomyces sp. T32_za158]|nr:hypothetical protein C0992_006226 [Termitomyces sp. T32_za158]